MDACEGMLERQLRPADHGCGRAEDHARQAQLDWSQSASAEAEETIGFSDKQGLIWWAPPTKKSYGLYGIIYIYIHMTGIRGQ